MGCCNAKNPLGLTTFPRETKNTTVKNTTIKVVHGDISYESVEAIVNAANSNLNHKGYVSEALVKKGGTVIQQESDQLVQESGQIPTGQVAVTGPGRLECKYIIHAVGPIYTDGLNSECEKLWNAIYNSLSKAQELRCCSISIPAVSSGIFGYPLEECAKIFFEVVRNFLEKNNDTCLKEIRLTNHDLPTVKVFEQEFERNFEENHALKLAVNETPVPNNNNSKLTYSYSDAS